MVDKFIEKYGQETLDKVLETLLDEPYGPNMYEDCTDKQCDDEGCQMYKAFKAYLKHK